MENNQDFKLLEKQIENNITDWYPFKDDTDYIILKDFSKDNIEELELSANNLKENGKILILMDNNLSVNSICTNNIDKDKLFNRKEIENILDKNGLIYRKFYYPLPDCKMTNVIFTDKHLPDRETITRNIKFYEENEIEKNAQNTEFKKILDQDSNLFKIFANSFFIECSKNQFEDNEIEFVSFSNMRKEEYRIKTIIKGDKVYKQAGNDLSKGHIEQIKKNIDILNKVNLNTLDRYEDTTIISSYQENRDTLDKNIIDKLKNGQVDDVKILINDLFKELKEKLIIVNPEINVFDKYEIKYEQKNIENLTFIKYGLWDTIFQNIFFIDDQYFFYDQEWIEENMPIEFIIYRAFKYNQELQNFLDVKEIYKDFNINEENLKLFIDLDNKLQEKTRSELNWKLHTNSINIYKDSNIIQNLKEQSNQKEQERKNIEEDCKKLLNEKDSRIKFLEDNMEQTCTLLKQKEEELERIKNSTSWKITEPLRKIRKNIKLL